MLIVQTGGSYPRLLVTRGIWPADGGGIHQPRLSLPACSIPSITILIHTLLTHDTNLTCCIYSDGDRENSLPFFPLIVIYYIHFINPDFFASQAKRSLRHNTHTSAHP
jgi:hypothetical protein